MGASVLLLSGRGLFRAVVALLVLMQEVVVPGEGPLCRGVTSIASDSNDARFAFTADEMIGAGHASGAGRGAHCVPPLRKDFAIEATLLLRGSELVSLCPSGLQGRSLAGSGEVGRPLVARFFSTIALFQGGKDVK